MPIAKIDMSERFIGRPVLISEEYAQSIVASSGKDLLIDDMRVEAAQMWLDVTTGTRKPYRMQGSIAVIPVNGRLYNKIDWAGFSYTGYNWIVGMLDYAEKDPDVKGVMLDVDSGGGEVDGAFETAERIRSFKKPIQAAATHAYSAAYLLASATNKISVTQTGGVGSIGVVTMHADYSKLLEKNGIAVTMIYKGKHKVDGNPYEPLPKDVRARTEARLEETYALFVDAVATGRSMDAQAVRDTEALTYGAKEAKSLGLVDTVASLDEALTAFEADLTGNKRGNITMTVATGNSQTTGAEQNGSNASTVVNQQALDAAKAEGAQQGAQAERARIMGIINCEEAKGRETLANVLCEQGLSVEAAKAILAAAPKADQVAANNGNVFESAMANTPNPEVANDQAASATDGNTPAWHSAIRALNVATGSDFKIN